LKKRKLRLNTLKKLIQTKGEQSMAHKKISELNNDIGKEVEIRGWAHRVRSSNAVMFVVMRDVSGIIQCVITKEEIAKEKWEECSKITVESSLIIKGIVKKEEKAPMGIELSVKDFELIATSESFPISKDFSPEFLADVRHLWLRSRKMTSILKIRSTVMGAVHNFFRNKGFYECQSPSIMSSQCEGGSTLFKVDYYGKELYLTQTWQLHAEAAIFALENIYCIAPSFRAEKSRTSRHLSEYWHAEMETVWCDFEELQEYAEKLIKHIIKEVLEKNKYDLEVLKRDISILENSLKKPFTKMTYDEALKILKEKHNMKVEWGKDLRTVEEDKLTSDFDTPIIVTKYPKIVKAFYMKEDPTNPDVVLGFDVLAPENYGELIGASQREEDQKKIEKRLLEQGEDLKNYQFYLDTRRYGSVPHSGFGMGIERIVSWICKLDTIKDAIAFPRTMTRYSP